jgi:hypothetical protein
MMISNTSSTRKNEEGNVLDESIVKYTEKVVEKISN